MIKEHIKYRLTAKSPKDISDDIIQELYQSVFSTVDLVEDQTILNLIKELKKDKTEITINDLGAGSKSNSSNKRQIRSIVKSTSTTGKYAKFVARLAKVFHSKHIIELGTSLGISSAFIASHNPQANIITIEGCANISKIAQKNLNLLGLKNITFVVGDFKTTLKEVLLLSKKPDFIFIDGDHTFQSTLNYFNFFKNKASKNAIIVFDDIKWSDGMINAWKSIVEDTQTRLSIDLNRMGVVFLNPQFPKKHFIIKY